MIDSTVIRAHACSTGYKQGTQKEEALGRSRGGLTTKAHVLVDALGLPLFFLLTPGQQNDITQAERLTENVRNIPVLADRGYDSDQFISTLEAKDCTPVIPSKKNRKKKREHDKYLYRERHLVECFFGKIKHFRRVFSRYEKLAKCYLSFLCFVEVFIWLR